MKNIFLFIFTIFALCSCNNGDLAPQNIANKTIYFSYDNASEIWFNSESDNGSICRDSFKLTEGDYDGGCNISSVIIPSKNTKEIKYNKIASNTARLVIEYNHIVDYIYILSFKTPTSGSAVRIWREGNHSAYSSDIEFTIK